MNNYTVLSDPPASRRKHCEGGMEQHFNEAAVMVAFAMYLLELGAKAVELHPDGEHGKRYDMKESLSVHGFKHVSTKGSTSYGGVYRRGAQTVTITLRPGFGDVLADIGDCLVVAECKGGVINSKHAGQTSRLRRGLCEAVGLLMARPLNGERHVAVVPTTETPEKTALRMLPRTRAAGIEIALVDQHGTVRFLNEGVTLTKPKANGPIPD